MMFSLTKNTFRILKNPINTKLNSSSCSNGLSQTTSNILKRNFATKKKKIIELHSQKVNLESLENKQTEKLQTQDQIKSYLQVRKKIQSLPWQTMQFHKLCALDKQLIDGLQVELKKDKFNITDQQFLANQLKSGKQLPLKTYQQLDRHYKKIFTLLKNTNDFYDQFPLQQQTKKGYLHEIYVTDLKSDKELNLLISRFIKFIAKPQKLQAIAEPTFVKYLLSAKRELLLQGVHFETKAEVKETKEKKEKVIESNEKENLPKIKILQILNYEYEFWQDVKHNRAKNGSEQNFMIQTREVPNPNQSLILRDIYPTVKIKYIARQKSSKNKERCFCIKADLLIEIDEKLKRRIKVEWKGPSDSKVNESKPVNKKPSTNEDSQQKAERVNYMVIDYEDIYDGNPTIRPIFYF